MGGHHLDRGGDRESSAGGEGGVQDGDPRQYKRDLFSGLVE